MAATDEGAELAREHIEHINEKLHNATGVMMLGYLLTQIGQYDKSQQYFERLLRNPNGEDLASIYYYMGAARYY